MRLSHVVRTASVRVGVVLGVAALAVFAFVAPASAHVTVNPGTATQGGFAKLAFRVPNEKPAANTVALEINIPATAPIASVSVKPIPGWTAEVTRTTLATPVNVHGRDMTEAVSKVVWTATPDAAVKPGQFQEFEISAGPMPEVDQIIFKALQTYSDGDIARWIDEPAPGVELERPAPILKLTPGGDDKSDTAGGEAAESDDGDGGVGVGIGFGVAGAVLGLAGLVMGVLAYRRSTPPPPPDSLGQSDPAQLPRSP